MLITRTVKIGETINNIIGRTLNPVNQLLSCGGSSGGKSGLIMALRKSGVNTFTPQVKLLYKRCTVAPSAWGLILVSKFI